MTDLLHQKAQAWVEMEEQMRRLDAEPNVRKYTLRCLETQLAIQEAFSILQDYRMSYLNFSWNQQTIQLAVGKNDQDYARKFSSDLFKMIGDNTIFENLSASMKDWENQYAHLASFMRHLDGTLWTADEADHAVNQAIGDEYFQQACEQYLESRQRLRAAQIKPAHRRTKPRS